MSRHSSAGTVADFLQPASRLDPEVRWHDLLEAYFPACLALFWPMLYMDVDWSVAPVTRDADLQRLTGVRPGAQGRTHIDKLFEVQLSGGEPALLFMQVQVQSPNGAGSAPRLYLYHYRPLDASTEPGMPAGVRSPGFDPVLAYRRAPLNGRFGQLEFVFPVAHVTAWRSRRDDLLGLAGRNPFALVVLAELDAADAGAPRERLARKTTLARLLHAHGYPEADVRRIFAFIDEALVLPPALEPAFAAALDEIRNEHGAACLAGA